MLVAGGIGAAAKPKPTGADALVEAYMSTYDVPGLSAAYGRGERIVFAEGYGHADRHRQVSPQSLFRIASLSKPLPRLPYSRWSKRAACASATLSSAHMAFSTASRSENMRIGYRPSRWSICSRTRLEDGRTKKTTRCSTPGVATAAFSSNRRSTFITLEDPPGKSYAYSNFGYFLLGRVIEKVSGLPYGEYVRQHVQEPLGITDMRLGRNDPAPDEVHYYGHSRDDPYAVPVDLHDANGGWIATPSDLVHFALGVFSADDHAGAPALLKPETLRQLTRASVANPRYACGWSVSPDGNYFHSGGFDGTASYLMHRHDGLAWAVVVNTRRAHSDMEKDLHKLSWDIARAARSRIGIIDEV